MRAYKLACHSLVCVTLPVICTVMVCVLLLSHSEWRYCTHHCCLPWPPSGGGVAGESGSLSRPPEEGKELTFTSLYTVTGTEDHYRASLWCNMYVCTTEALNFKGCACTVYPRRQRMGLTTEGVWLSQPYTRCQKLIHPLWSAIHYAESAIHLLWFK